MPEDADTPVCHTLLQKTAAPKVRFHQIHCHIPAETFLPARHSKAESMKQIFVSYSCPFPVELFALYGLECKIQKQGNVKYE